MKVIMFSPRFHEPVRTGTKTQTIRGEQKRPAQAGTSLSLRAWSATPYRSPQVVLRLAVCITVQPVRIHVHGWTDIEIAGITLRQDEIETFVRNDGFTDLKDFRNHWINNHGYEAFEGTLIRWRPSI